MQEVTATTTTVAETANHDGNKLVKMRVLGFPYSTTASDLMTFFSECGPITDLELPGNRRGTARLTILAEKKDQMLALNGKYLGERYVKIVVDENIPENQQRNMRFQSKRFPPFRQSRGFQDPMPAMEDSKVLFCGNLPYNLTEDELRAFFSNCGEIIRVHWAVDRYSQRFKGFAHVEFLDILGAKNALSLQGMDMKGRPIKINPSRPLR